MGRQNDERTWRHALQRVQSEPEIREALIEFLVNNKIALVTDPNPVAGTVTYSVEFNRPHIAEVERAPGRKHWTVRENES